MRWDSAFWLLAFDFSSGEWLKVSFWQYVRVLNIDSHEIMELVYITELDR